MSWITVLTLMWVAGCLGFVVGLWWSERIQAPVDESYEQLFEAMNDYVVALGGNRIVSEGEGE